MNTASAKNDKFYLNSAKQQNNNTSNNKHKQTKTFVEAVLITWRNIQKCRNL